MPSRPCSETRLKPFIFTEKWKWPCGAMCLCLNESTRMMHSGSREEGEITLIKNQGENDIRWNCNCEIRAAVIISGNKTLNRGPLQS